MISGFLNLVHARSRLYVYRKTASTLGSASTWLGAEMRPRNVDRVEEIAYMKSSREGLCFGRK